MSDSVARAGMSQEGLLLLEMKFNFYRAVLLGGKCFASVLWNKKVAASLFTHGFRLWLSITPPPQHESQVHSMCPGKGIMAATGCVPKLPRQLNYTEVVLDVSQSLGSCRGHLGDAMAV